jgi:hypothetical protein
VNDIEPMHLYKKNEEGTYFSYTFRTGVNKRLTSPDKVVEN